MRSGAVLACATRITSSNDMRTARCRAVSRNSSAEPSAFTGIEAVEIERGVAAILVGGEAADALLDHVQARGRIATPRALDQVLDALRRRLALAMLAHGLLELAARMAAAEGEGGKIGVDRLAGMADRGLEGGIRDRQPARARQRAQQHGIDDAARFLGGLVHVEQDLFLAALLHGAQQAADIEAAVAHRRALADRQHAMRRGDEGRAVGRDEAVEDHAAGFEQLGRQRHVDLADGRD